MSETSLPIGTQSRFIDLPSGLRHHVVEAGGDGPTLVLLHGYTDSWRSFEPILGPLDRRFRLLIPDQRGHGASGEAEHYALADFTADAIAVIEALADGPVYLAGHSLGSIVSQRVAASRPDLIRALVLIGAASEAAGHAGLLELRAELAGLPATIPRDFIEAFQQSTTFAALPDRQLAIFVEESLKLKARTWWKVLDGLLDEPRQPPWTLSLPTLVLWGVEDGVFDESAQHRLARHIPTLTAIHYAGVGHAPHWENPARTAKDITDFLATVEAQPLAAEKDIAHHA